VKAPAERVSPLLARQIAGSSTPQRSKIALGLIVLLCLVGFVVCLFLAAAVHHPGIAFGPGEAPVGWRCTPPDPKGIAYCALPSQPHS
jgi:hypothetical protein